MLKEEKELRKTIKESVLASEEYFATWPYYSRLITALVKAVREDAAKLCEAASSPASITNAGAFYAHIIRNGKMEHGKYLRDKQAAIRRK